MFYHSLEIRFSISWNKRVIETEYLVGGLFKFDLDSNLNLNILTCMIKILGISMVLSIANLCIGDYVIYL